MLVFVAQDLKVPFPLCIVTSASLEVSSQGVGETPYRAELLKREKRTPGLDEPLFWSKQGLAASV